MNIVRGSSMDLQPAACFNCDSRGGYYRAHEGETRWFMGLDSSGQAHFACEECSVLLFNARPYYREEGVAKWMSCGRRWQSWCG